MPPALGWLDRAYGGPSPKDNFLWLLIPTMCCTNGILFYLWLDMTNLEFFVCKMVSTILSTSWDAIRIKIIRIYKMFRTGHLTE